MKGFVQELDCVEEVDLAPARDTASDAKAPQRARQGRTGPLHTDETIRTFRGMAFGVPLALGLWAAIIGVSAYLIA